MSEFVITREDGTNDLVEGESVEDVATRYGWPGNGDIQPFSKGTKIDRTFPTVEDQNAILNAPTKGDHK